jgi:cytochrome c-type biogenesis protein CcmH/NrfG
VAPPETRHAPAHVLNQAGKQAEMRGISAAPVRGEETMSRQINQTFTPLTAVTGVAGVLFGIIIGYLLGTSQGSGAAQVAVAAPPAQTASVPVVNEQELQALRNILAGDPKNLKANVELANRLYDAGRYAEAVPYYQQAFAVDGRNVGVSTDLATALFYAGRADEALTQFDRSLQIDPKHAQTLFNIGIVKRDAKQDRRGAVDAWRRLLDANPTYPEAAKVRTMIAELGQP